MKFYSCGHDRKPIFISKGLSKEAVMFYNFWKVTCGFDGDKSKCLACWNNEAGR